MATIFDDDGFDQFRSFEDIDAQRRQVYRRAREGLAGLAPLANATHSLELADVRYDEDEDDWRPPKSAEKKAILHGVSLHRPLHATLRLRDNATGQVLDERRAPIARIPHLNSRGLFIRRGVVWALRNQQRLRPGVYVRRRADGGSEAHFNIRPTTGRGFRVLLEPESGLFKVQVGQSTTRLYPLLRQLGVTDKQMKDAWGQELFDKNYRRSSGHDEQDMRKLVQKLGPKTGGPVDADLLPQVMKEILERSEVDPETTEITMGRRIKNLSPVDILQASALTLDVQRGKRASDNRDSQAFQTIHSAEDFIEERLKRDQAGGLRRLLWRASKDGKLPDVAAGALDRNLDGLFQGSGLAMAVEDVNPFEIHDARQAITRLGEGGISSTQSVSRDARGVQASYLGVIDAGRGPECYDAQTEVMTRRGWVPWPDVRLGDEFACLVGGSVSYHPPLALHASEWRGRMHGASNTHIDYLVTPNHRMWSRCEGRLRDGRPCAYNIKFAADFGGHRLVHSSGFGPYVPGKPVTEFLLPPVGANGATPGAAGAPPIGARLINHTDPIDITDWLRFLGWYLAEGSTRIQVQRGHYVTHITQVESANPENVEEIKLLLERLPFTWNYARGKVFTISGKQLALYLHQFGLCSGKFIPDYVFEAPVEAREAFVETLLKGDGKRWHSTDERRALHTTSARLAHDFQRLMFSLGRSTRHTVTVDDREERYLDVHMVYVHTRDERLITSKPRRREESDYYIVEDFRGVVYCATVPGGLLYVRRNNHLGFWCGNSQNLGLDLRVTDAALKGPDNQLYTRVINARTGEPEIVSARTLSRKTVTFPGEMERDGRRVPVVRDDKMTYAAKNEVDYIIPGANALMSRATAMIPFPESIKGQRLLMGARFTQQAMPLKEAEAPLVQAADADGQSLHKVMGGAVGAQFSDIEGVVTKVTPDEIKITTPEGEKKVITLYNNYPAARKTMLHNTPVVEKGSYVKKGQLVARSNFTDNNGAAAIGRNLRVAFMAAEGDTIEDAFVISESAAKKLTSEALYKADLDLSDIETTDKKAYRSVYTDRFTPAQYDKLDDNGVVREGATVEPGDPLILGMAKKPNRGIGAVMVSPKSQVTDRSETWDHHAPGVVTDVVRTRKGIKVSVKSYDVTRAADKLCGRFGNKGVTASIRPDDQMPIDENGEPIEVIANSLGIISRTNPAVLAEALLGKVAAKTGKPYVIQGFSGKDVADFALRQAVLHGVAREEGGRVIDTETLTDPRDGRKIPGVFTGVSYFMKPHHMAESKLSARDVGSYTTEGFPARGGKEGSKRIGTADVSSLLSAGATEFIKDAKLVRGQRNDEYWRLLRSGEQPIEPTESFADEHFRALLRGAGVSLREKGSRTQLSPLLDQDVDQLAEHEIENPGTFNFETMRPVPGGLFDLGRTGGADGNRYAKITLPRPIPHPLFVEPIQKLLGLTAKGLEDVLAGRQELGGKTGPEAVHSALSELRVDQEIARAKETIKLGRQSKRDAAVKRLNYLTGLKNLEIDPAQLMVTKIPVIPPKYRPIVQARGMDMVNDLNYLYHDLLEARENYNQAQEEFGKADDEYLTMWHAVRAISGVRDPVNPKSAEQGVKGILRYAIGVKGTPKAAYYQRKVIGSAVDTVGRGVITADKNLDMDEVGIPEDMAWSIYRPFVTRRLARLGVPATDALKAVKDRTPMATKALEDEMRTRPVVYNRAPALHRYAYVGAWPKLRKDDAIGMPYQTLKGANADFDGDQINLHVPTSDEAVAEVKEKLLPSKNLFFTGDFETHLEPVQDYVAGLYLASVPDADQPVKTFATKDEAKRAYARGEIGARTPIRILRRGKDQ